MEYYIHLNSFRAIVSLDFTLDEGTYEVGTTWDDYLDGKWVKLSEEQVMFKEEHPEATISEVWNMKLNEPEVDEDALLKEAKAKKIEQAADMFDTKVNEATYEGELCFEYAEDRAIILSKVGTAKRQGGSSIVVNSAVVPVDLIDYLFDELDIFETACETVYNEDVANINACGTKELVEQLVIGNRYPAVPQLTADQLQAKKEDAASVDANIQLMSFARMTINTMSLTDEQSLECKLLYPEWKEFIGKSLTAGFKVLHNNKLYKVRQEVSVVLDQDGYRPGEQGSEALYEEINETHAGTLEDPIPYNNNMELFNGKYYSQYNVIYLCNRDTGQAVYNNLADLVGIYVQIVE